MLETVGVAEAFFVVLALASFAFASRALSFLASACLSVAVVASAADEEEADGVVPTVEEGALVEGEPARWGAAALVPAEVLGEPSALALALGRGAALVVGRAVAVGLGAADVGAGAAGGATVGEALVPSRKPTALPGAGSYR